MFPYPSGAGLHVGHPLGYIGTDVYARFMRMKRPQRAARDGLRRLRAPGRAVRGADRPAPASHHRGQHRQHAPPAAGARARPRPAPRRRHHRRRLLPLDAVDLPADLRLLVRRRRRTGPGPIAELSPSSRPAPARPRATPTPTRMPWRELDGDARRAVVDSYRLAYLDEAPVNWCPALGTVLANEEVTADGRSERGNHPVFRRPLKQWMLRITAYADRLLADLDLLDWPESIKLHAAQLDRPQRRRRGRRSRSRSTTASRSRSSRPVPTRSSAPPTWCSRPSTRSSTRSSPTNGPQDSPFEWRGTFGLDKLPAEAVASYREFAAQKSELERQAEGREKTGVFTGAFANNPTNGWSIPVFVADYVLMGYGTGAIMAVPAHDQRDFEFARRVRPADRRRRAAARRLVARARGSRADTPADEWPEAYTGDGVGMNSANDEVSLDGLPTADGEGPHHRLARGGRRAARRRSPTSCATGCSAGSATGASRSRSSTTPTACRHALPESMLPVELPDITDFEPRILADDDTALPEPPLARADDWVHVELDLGDGPQRYRRETNTMPQWAGSCWYYLRYLDPTNADALVDPEVERYWMVGTGAPADGRRRPLRRRCRARGAAPPLRALLAQGAVRPRPRLDARAVPPPLQPGHDHRGRVHRRARRLRRGRRGRGARRLVVRRRRRGGAPRREDGQEPEERGRARRHLPRLRRRHAAALRDVHGPARREPAVEHAGHRRRAPVPAAVLAQRRRRGHR